MCCNLDPLVKGSAYLTLYTGTYLNIGCLVDIMPSAQLFIKPFKLFLSLYICLCVREREIERERARGGSRDKVSRKDERVLKHQDTHTIRNA